MVHQSVFSALVERMTILKVMGMAFLIYIYRQLYEYTPGVTGPCIASNMDGLRVDAKQPMVIVVDFCKKKNTILTDVVVAASLTSSERETTM